MFRGAIVSYATEVKQTLLELPHDYKMVVLLADLEGFSYKEIADILANDPPMFLLGQFRDADGRSTLGDYVDVPGVYPAGRLDYDSEGLLILTDDGRLFVVVGDAPAMEAKLIERKGGHDWQTLSVFETDLKPLVHGARPVEFSF